MFNPLDDLVNNAGGGVSILPGSTALTGTTVINGAAIDCQQLDGPVHGIFALGAATGAPDSFTVTCKLTECETSGGSYTDMADQTSLVLTSGSSRGFVRGTRTKRYVKCVETPAFVGGTSPTIPSSAQIVGQKHSY